MLREGSDHNGLWALIKSGLRYVQPFISSFAIQSTHPVGLPSYMSTSLGSLTIPNTSRESART